MLRVQVFFMLAKVRTPSSPVKREREIEIKRERGRVRKRERAK
jgi:hypothetical protein